MSPSFNTVIPSLLVVIASSTVFHMSVGTAIAQVRPDQTLSNASQVSKTGSIHRIRGGSQAGRNLFHSFTEFSVPTNQTAVFQNSKSVRHIFTRVTGGTASRIDGTIEAQGEANVFLLNPNGISFGENAQLKVGGSFLGSTASGIVFKDGQQFNASHPRSNPILTMSSPVGLQFGLSPEPIQVTGPGHQTFVDFPFIRDRFRPNGLQVNQGKTLALVGGQIELRGGNLTARDGRLLLKSLSNPGQIKIASDSLGFKSPASKKITYGDIHLTQASSLVTSGKGGGNIQLQGHSISLSEGSTLQARIMEAGIGSGIQVHASNQLLLSGFVADNFGPAFPTSLLTDVAVNGTGQGGNIQINSPILQISEGAILSAGTFDQGSAGSVEVNAQVVDLLGVGPFGSSGLFADTFGPGMGGNIKLKTQQLIMSDGAQISASTLLGSPLGSGTAGDINIQASSIELLGGAPGVGSSGLFSNTDTDQPGGKIILQTQDLLIADGAQAATFAIGSGSSGNIELKANQIDLIGTASNGIPSGLFTTVVPGASGAAGKISVSRFNAPLRLRVQSGAQISSATTGKGDSGIIDIAANQLVLDGANTPVNGVTGLLAVVESGGTGQGGALQLRSQTIEVKNGAQITAGTRGPGAGGDLNIRAQTITLEGGDSAGQSGLFVNALESDGESGNLNILTRDLRLLEGATINASTFPSQGAAIAPGRGTAGNIRVNAAQGIELNQGSSIVASTAMGDRGNITLIAPTIFLRNQSAIAANAFGTSTGGNLIFDTELLIGSQNSDITANAAGNFGGNITVNTTGLLGFQIQDQLTSFSDITASSALGPRFSGLVEINTPEIDPSKGLSKLPEVVADPNRTIQSTCRPTQSSSFSITGRGGQPDQSSSPLKAESYHGKSLTQSFSNPAQTATKTGPKSQATQGLSKQEAKSWQRDANGHLQLLAWSKQDIRLQPTQGSVGCSI